MSDRAGAGDHGARNMIAWHDVLCLAAVSFGIAFALRLMVLPLSVVDWDESLYLLVTRDLLDGRFPYEGAFEHKPVALYYLFAIAQLVFGEGIMAMRLLGTVACGATALLIGLLLRMCVSASMLVAATVAAAYSILSVLNGGFATNTEILLNFYATLAIFLLIHGRLAVSTVPMIALVVGAVLALMFNTNYLAAIPLAGIGAGYMYAALRSGRFVVALAVCLKNGLVVLAGFGITTIGLLLPIAIWGDIGDYFSRQLSFLSVYGSSVSPLSFVARLNSGLQPYGFLIALVCTVLAFAAFGGKQSWIDPRGRGAIAAQVAIYLVSTFLACIISGRMYPHYFILMLPALCILGGLFLTWLRVDVSFRNALTLWFIIMAVISLGLESVKISANVEGFIAWLKGNPPDLPSEIARDFSTSIQPGEVIYVYDYQPILYYLLKAKIPLKYVFPPHHLRSKYGLEPENEIEAVMAQSPRLIIAGSDPVAERYGAASRKLAEALGRRYELAKIYPVGRAAVRVYRRNDGAGRSQ